MSKFVDFFKKLFGFVVHSDPFKKLLSVLLPQAIQIVSGLASVEGLSNSAKRDQAADALVRLAKAQGLAFGDHMINLILEIAVAKLKGTIAEG